MADYGGSWVRDGSDTGDDDKADAIRACFDNNGGDEWHFHDSDYAVHGNSGLYGLRAHRDWNWINNKEVIHRLSILIMNIVNFNK
jgi:hypothetical protein